ncbi:Methyltransferase type 11 [Niveomyces insectorum RCEF 264]|uniref:Methyltransferase type 11 n=1 Tax=Niveomyces insectorum RCEF 264 TaxID=1081102 RepID=A0A167M5D5_9HYPO|nr:Methyltransferase type 11 [Niveomyces insectorum RCEF 264]
MSQTNTYKQTHSDYTLSTHLKRTAEKEAAFLLPHIKKSDHILDVGCGPGTITTGFAKYASQGAVVGIDLAASVIEKARTLAAEARVPVDGPGSVVFREGNVLAGLPYPDNTFDVVYCSQVLGHIPPPVLQVQAVVEMRRVLKPGGVLAAREGTDTHFYPRHLGLDRHWAQNQARVFRGDLPPHLDNTGAGTPALFRQAGFDADNGKVVIGADVTVFSGKETRQWLLWRAKGQLKQGDPYYQSWLDAGISAEEIQEALAAVEVWANTDDAWALATQAQTLGWK